MGTNDDLAVPELQAEATKSPVQRGFPRADDGTRTHDLLHGNATRSVTRCRLVPPHARRGAKITLARLQEAARDGTARKPNACKPLAVQAGSAVTAP
jgi:hypothetical protein